MKAYLARWFATGTPFIWLHAGAVSVSILMVIGLVALLAVRGLSHFWPIRVAVFEIMEQDGNTARIMGEISDRETVDPGKVNSAVISQEPDRQLINRYLIKTGNRDISGMDFRWVPETALGEPDYPEAAMVVERREWGNFYGFPGTLRENGNPLPGSEPIQVMLQQSIAEATVVFDEIRHIEKDLIGAINYQMEQLRLQERGLQLNEITDTGAYEEIAAQRRRLQSDYNELIMQLDVLYGQLNRKSIIAATAEGTEVEIPLARIVSTYYPNAMSVPGKMIFYMKKLWEFVSDEPREANTEGGIYPAIFGTVLMVMIMSLLVTPFGVIAAVYLREYAKQGLVTRLIRIAVNNLAGVPSIVYGVFGLGFFIYFLGGNIDELFFREALPTPTFGTPGLLWASLTLAILTVPVVIVATEEGLSRVPMAIREGSLALGASKAETLFFTVMPMTAPAIMTGMILAIARAAGEVAPLMLVGVVKLAPALPLDGNFPYLHLDRKFMHLGFHIYDVGFQSPNVEAARPLVFATALLLVVVIIVLNLAAIKIRNNLREKYRAAEQH
jgi:phosphate transport system permease protein